jgi:hypothetical protein
MRQFSRPNSTLGRHLVSGRTKYLVARRCLKWVKSVVLTVGRPLPVCPDQRTFSAPAGMSQRCQFRNWERCDGAQRGRARAAAARPTAPGGTNCPEGRSYQALYPRPEPNLDLCRPTVRTNRPYPLIVHRHKDAPHNGQAVNSQL